MADKSDKPTENKPVIAKKARYFVPTLGKSVEAKDLDEVTEIVKKENASRKATKG